MPESFNASEVRSYYQTRVHDLRISNGREWRGQCPIHGGKRHNFAVNPDTGLWTCFSKCGRGGDIISLERELTGTDFVTARNTVYDIVGRDMPTERRGLRSAGERRRFARRKELAEGIGILARRWHQSRVRALESRKQSVADIELEWIAICQELFILESMTPRQVIEVFMRSAREQPEQTACAIAQAEADERASAQLTAIAVQIIAKAGA